MDQVTAETKNTSEAIDIARHYYNDRLQKAIQAAEPLGHALNIVNGHTPTTEGDYTYTYPRSYRFNELYGALVTRPGNAEFYQTVPLGLTDEKLATLPEGTANKIQEIKEALPELVAQTAQALDILPHEPPQEAAPDSFEAAIGINTVDHQKLPPSDATFVGAGAGLTTIKRAHYAFTKVERGELATKRLVLVSCFRPESPAKKDEVAKAGLTVGQDEFEETVAAAKDRLDITQSLDELLASATELALPHYAQPNEEPPKAKIIHLNKEGYPPVTIIAAPHNHNRRFPDGKAPVRANTAETFEVGALAVKLEAPRRLTIIGHDIWTQYVGQSAVSLFTPRFGTLVDAVGPTNANRLVRNHNNQWVISPHDRHNPTTNPLADTIDQISKVLFFLNKTVDNLGNVTRS